MRYIFSIFLWSHSLFIVFKVEIHSAECGSPIKFIKIWNLNIWKQIWPSRRVRLIQKFKNRLFGCSPLNINQKSKMPFCARCVASIQDVTSLFFFICTNKFDMNLQHFISFTLSISSRQYYSRQIFSVDISIFVIIFWRKNVLILLTEIAHSPRPWIPFALSSRKSATYLTKSMVAYITL